MNNSVRELLDQVERVPDFYGTKLNDINDTNTFGDNALHVVCVWGDLEAVRLLVENGINIEQQGEGGYTPLKIAGDFEYTEIVDYLISQGANIDALDAEFEFDSEADLKHMKKLQNGIEELEQKIKSECEKNA